MILLMRHGESTWNAAGRMQGQDPRPPLTPRGRDQVAATAELLGARIGAIVSSPARRARESADVVAAHTGLGVVEEPLLVEKGLDEQWESVERRIRAVVAAHRTAGTLLVTHGDVVGCAALLLAGAALPPVANASVLALTPRTGDEWSAEIVC